MSKCEMSKSVGCRQIVQSAKTRRLFRLASRLGGTEERGAGEGCGDGSVGSGNVRSG